MSTFPSPDYHDLLYRRVPWKQGREDQKNFQWWHITLLHETDLQQASLGTSSSTRVGLINKTFSGSMLLCLEWWLSSGEHCLLLQRIWIQCPEPRSVSSWLPVTPAPTTPTPSSGLHGYSHTPGIHLYRHIQVNKKLKKWVNIYFFIYFSGWKSLWFGHFLDSGFWID